MIKTIKILILSSFICISVAVDVYGQNNREPIEITADNTLEWHRNDKQYIARGNAIAKQGTAYIHGETLIAHYKDSQEKSFQISKLIAEKNVQLKDETNTAYGEKAVYEIEKGLAIMTGNDLKLVSPDQVITAKDRFEYDVNKSEARAIGNAKVVRTDNNQLEAQTIIATFKNGDQEQQALETLEAINTVIITTPTEILKGDRGHYKAASNTATLTGNVRIERGPNILEGNRAEIDLTTNISKIFSSDQTGERVRGVFYPESNKDSQETN